MLDGRSWLELQNTGYKSKQGLQYGIHQCTDKSFWEEALGCSTTARSLQYRSAWLHCCRRDFESTRGTEGLLRFTFERQAVLEGCEGFAVVAVLGLGQTSCDRVCDPILFERAELVHSISTRKHDWRTIQADVEVLQLSVFSDSDGRHGSDPMIQKGSSGCL